MGVTDGHVRERAANRVTLQNKTHMAHGLYSKIAVS